jgi:hypothetical protein
LTQWIFRWHFNIHQNNNVHSLSTLLLWVRNSIYCKKKTSRKRACC